MQKQRAATRPREYVGESRETATDHFDMCCGDGGWETDDDEKDMSGLDGGLQVGGSVWSGCTSWLDGCITRLGKNQTGRVTVWHKLDTGEVSVIGLTPTSARNFSTILMPPSALTICSTYSSRSLKAVRGKASNQAL